MLVIELSRILRLRALGGPLLLEVLAEVLNQRDTAARLFQ
jgi:hypothetical protein